MQLSVRRDASNPLREPVLDGREVGRHESLQRLDLRVAPDFCLEHVVVRLRNDEECVVAIARGFERRVLAETVTAAAEELEAVAAATDGQTAVIDEVVADKGYHSNQVLVDLAALDLRTYIAEPDRGRRRWKKKAAARDAVYANRRRIRGARGLALLRRRSERLERPNAHLYETGAMRRTHLGGHTNILKRLVVHTGGFNLSLLMRTLFGIGTPRSLQGRLAAVVALVIGLWTHAMDLWRDHVTPSIDDSSTFRPHHRFELLPVDAVERAL
jgi:hypothetical protein